MSKQNFRRWILLTVAWLVLYAGAYAWAALTARDYAKVLEPLIPIAVAVPAAVLAGGFNRRNSYLQATRDLWHRLVPAAQLAIQYTHLSNPDQRHFAETERALSTAIDMVRGVFSNVRDGSATGLYPYENLKDIEKIIAWLGYGKTFRRNDAKQARKCVTRLWQQMHAAMLDEFDRDVPVTPVGKYVDGRDASESLADLLIRGCLTEDDMARGRFASAPRRG